MIRKHHIIIVFTVLVLVGSCKKDDQNPFDAYNLVNQEPQELALDPNTIEGIHKNIFSPTCANSGCHDGTFEPDFRSVQSSYNSLVYHPIIKQDNDNPLTYRVTPGNAGSSMLVRRLKVDLGGNSGIMPLAVDPDSDWPNQKTTYIQNIENWINNGAKDIFGNDAASQNRRPDVSGLFASTTSNTTPFDRETDLKIMVDPANSAIDLYFAVRDNETSPQNLTDQKIMLSRSRDDFSNAIPYSLSFLSSSITQIGYEGDNVNYNYKSTISDFGSQFSSGEQVFVRLEIKDPEHDITYIPGLESMEHIKLYFTLIVL